MKKGIALLVLLLAAFTGAGAVLPQGAGAPAASGLSTWMIVVGVLLLVALVLVVLIALISRRERGGRK